MPQFSIVFKPMSKDLAEIVAAKLCNMTGCDCRLRRSFQHSFTVERDTGSRWVVG